MESADLDVHRRNDKLVNSPYSCNACCINLPRRHKTHRLKCYWLEHKAKKEGTRCGLHSCLTHHPPCIYICIPPIFNSLAGKAPNTHNPNGWTHVMNKKGTESDGGTVRADGNRAQCRKPWQPARLMTAVVRASSVMAARLRQGQRVCRTALKTSL